MRQSQVSVIPTADGSKTLFFSDLHETYHSTHGAKTESMHVYINQGLKFWLDRASKFSLKIQILEMGFGTGLNAVLAYDFFNRLQTTQELQIAVNSGDSFSPIVHYHAIEKYPLTMELMADYWLNQSDMGLQLHAMPWNELSASRGIEVTENLRTFSFSKYHLDVLDFPFEDHSLAFDVIFWDAFAPSKQPHLWSEGLFKQVFSTMSVGGVFVTYSASGAVRRALIAAGFSVERIPGPPGKREMLRAIKS